MANHAYKTLHSADNITVMILMYSGMLYDDVGSYAKKTGNRNRGHNSSEEFDNFHSTDIEFYETETAFNRGSWPDVLNAYINPQYCYLYDGRTGSANNSKDSGGYLSATLFDTNSYAYDDKMVDNLRLPSSKCYIRGNSSSSLNESNLSQGDSIALSPSKIAQELDDLLLDQSQTPIPTKTPKASQGNKGGFGKKPVEYTDIMEVEVEKPSGKDKIIQNKNSAIGDEDLNFLLDDNNFS
mgnify:CR=1 FL=1